MVCDISSIFSRSFVISIDDERLGRFYRVMESVFGDSGFYVPPRFVRGVTNGSFRTEKRIIMSHVGIIERAKALGMPSVLIFEDDAVPHPDAAKLMRHYLSDLPDDCRVLQLGTNFRRPREILSAQLVRAGNTRGAHAYIVFEAAYDAFINCHRFVHIDHYFARVARTYLPGYDLFVQFVRKRSAHTGSGYCHGDHHVTQDPPKGFLRPVELTMRAFPSAFSEKEICKMQDAIHAREMSSAESERQP